MLKHKIEKIIDFINTDIETDKSRLNKKRTYIVTSLFLTIVPIIMAIVNYINNRYTMFYMTILITVVFFFCFVCCMFFYSETIIKYMTSGVIIAVFSFFVIYGGNNGFAILWTVLVPIVYVAIMSLKSGILAGLYFEIFIILFFWTPLREFLQYDYSQDTLQRYPIFYTCGYALAIIMGVKEHRLRIIEKDNDDKLNKAIIEEHRRVEVVSIDAISSISQALEARDNYTRRHSENVTFYSMKIAGKLSMTKAELETLQRAAMLHDLGKIGIPDAILNKEGRLTDEEYNKMKTHVTVGADILSYFTTMPELVVGARYHHERYDGKGYAQGLSGEDIPLEGRIIAIADAIDAMYSTRPYRKKTDKDYVRDEIVKGSGKQFDPQLASIAVELIDNGMLEEMDAIIK